MQFLKKPLFGIRTKLLDNNFFSEYLLEIEMNKTQIFINKPVFLGPLVLEVSEIVMQKFWYDYVKTKYWRKSKFMLHGYRQLYNLHKYIYVDIAKDAETTLNTLNDELVKPLPRRKNEKVNRLMKDELDGKIITEFSTLKPKQISNR